MDIYLDTWPVECPAGSCLALSINIPSVSRDVGGDAPSNVQETLAPSSAARDSSMSQASLLQFEDRPPFLSELVVWSVGMLSVGTQRSGGRRGVGCRQACLVGLLLACLWRGRWLPALEEKPAVGHPGPLVVWEHL